MVITKLFLVLVLAAAQGETATNMEVDGFGTIHLPAGEWKLETHALSRTPDKTPDAIVLRKASDTIERITILRYGKSISPSKPVLLCDSIADSMPHGLPSFLFEVVDRSRETVYPIRVPRDLEAARAEVTNIYSDGEGVNWMNHGIVQASGDVTFVFVHSSPGVLTPDTILDVLLMSKIEKLKVTK